MTNAEVRLWGSTIGYVSFDSGKGFGRFEYAADFLSSGIEVAPLMMPLSTRVFSFPELNPVSFHGLPGMLADSLPDKFGNAVIDAWLISQGRAPESFNPVERLCYTGSRGMGALEYYPVVGPDLSKAQRIEMDKLVGLASDVLKVRSGFNIRIEQDSLKQIISVGSSAGGARAKAIIAWNEKTGELRSGQIPIGTDFDYWLLKFDGISNNGDKEGPDPEQFTRIEYAYSLMAKKAGINMEECRLLEENGRAHFMTRRFDRDRNTHSKIHMQTLGAIGHFDFNLSGSCGYEQASMVMKQMSVSFSDISQLYRRMVFNVLGMNHDDHVKNISFLMTRSGEWHLSPAYDITFVFNPKGKWTSSHQMTINGKQENITLNDLLESARYMGIKKRSAMETIVEVRDGISQWPEFAQKAGLSQGIASSIEEQLVSNVMKYRGY